MVERSVSAPDTGWIGRALIRRWLLFRRSFVAERQLVPVIAYGWLSQATSEEGIDIQPLFRSGFHWCPVGIDDLDVYSNELRFVAPGSVNDMSEWDRIQATNAVAWSPDGQAFAAIAGSDTLCLLAHESQLEAAFGRTLESIDCAVVEQARLTIEEVERRRPERFDDVWLRNYSWLRCFR